MKCFNDEQVTQVIIAAISTGERDSYSVQKIIAATVKALIEADKELIKYFSLLPTSADTAKISNRGSK